MHPKKNADLHGNFTLHFKDRSWQKALIPGFKWNVRFFFAYEATIRLHSSGPDLNYIDGKM